MNQDIFGETGYFWQIKLQWSETSMCGTVNFSEESVLWVHCWAKFFKQNVFRIIWSDFWHSRPDNLWTIAAASCQKIVIGISRLWRRNNENVGGDNAVQFHGFTCQFSMSTQLMNGVLICGTVLQGSYKWKARLPFMTAQIHAQGWNPSAVELI